jgi:hypothetical protein
MHSAVAYSQSCDAPPSPARAPKDRDLAGAPEVTLRARCSGTPIAGLPPCICVRALLFRRGCGFGRIPRTADAGRELQRLPRPERGQRGAGLSELRRLRPPIPDPCPAGVPQRRAGFHHHGSHHDGLHRPADPPVGQPLCRAGLAECRPVAPDSAVLAEGERLHEAGMRSVTRNRGDSRTGTFRGSPANGPITWCFSS